MSESKNIPKLSAALDGKYEAVGVVPGEITGKKFGTVDLRSISLEQAEKLVAAGFPYLKKVEKPAKTEAEGGKK